MAKKKSQKRGKKSAPSSQEKATKRRNVRAARRLRNLVKHGDTIQDVNDSDREMIDNESSHVKEKKISKASSDFGEDNL